MIMEDAEGYMVVEPSRHVYTDTIPKKTEAPSKCCKITLWIIMGGSIALNLALIVLLIASVNFDPDTAHHRLVISSDQKTATWGKAEKPLPDNDKRFSSRVWVLGQNGFRSGKHYWEVEIKHDGEWAVGVARESVKRNGLTDFSTKEGIWAIGEHWGKRNYVAFTEPEHSKIFFYQKPRWIRVFLDYLYQEVTFFNVGTMKTIFTFSNASFSGEKIYPWFWVWDGTELTVHP